MLCVFKLEKLTKIYRSYKLKIHQASRNLRHRTAYKEVAIRISGRFEESFLRTPGESI